MGHFYPKRNDYYFVEKDGVYLLLSSTRENDGVGYRLKLQKLTPEEELVYRVNNC